VHNHTFGAKPIRVVYGIQGVAERTGSFIRVSGSTLITIRCRIRNLDRKRTEVVEARHGHRVISKEPLNTFPQREPNPVAEFDMVETEAKNFAQHFVALRVAARIPTGGEGYLHETDALPRESVLAKHTSGRGGDCPRNTRKNAKKGHGKFERDGEISCRRAVGRRRCNDRSSPINPFPVPFSRFFAFFAGILLFYLAQVINLNSWSCTRCGCVGMTRTLNP
jgi:hypothetical protein